jgi:hypothetical protein
MAPKGAAWLARHPPLWHGPRRVARGLVAAPRMLP